MNDKKMMPTIFLMLVMFAAGFGSAMLISYSSTEDTYVNIISIKDKEEVHSIVVIDAIFDKGDEVGVWINGTLVSDYLPYYWNNMLFPVGEYEIAVGVNKNDQWTYDNTTVIIPEEFVVPANYTFSEDFVVHKGQTVTFANGSWDAFINDYSNGNTPLDEKTYWSINVFGTVLIDNATIKCKYFTVENGAEMYLQNSSVIHPVEKMDLKIYDNSGNYVQDIIGLVVRFDDNSSLYLDETMVPTHVTDMVLSYDYFVTGQDVYFVLYEDSEVFLP